MFFELSEHLNRVLLVKQLRALLESQSVAHLVILYGDNKRDDRYQLQVFWLHAIVYAQVCVKQVHGLEDGLVRQTILQVSTVKKQ